MTTEHTGRGDPARTLALLWGTAERPTHGPKPGLSLARVVAAAVELADAEGLAALSMRRLAQHLGTSPMGLYTYVPGKAELVDLMVDAVYVEPTTAVAEGAGWRERLAATAHDAWARYRRHPWLLQVAATNRPPLGPNVTAAYDRDLAAVDGLGLSEVEMDLVVGLVHAQAEGAARRLLEAAQIRRQSGQTDAERWAATEPIFAKIFDPARFPTAARVGPAAGAAYNAAADPERAFAFGLDLLLAGIEALIRARRTGER